MDILVINSEFSLLPELKSNSLDNIYLNTSTSKINKLRNFFIDSETSIQEKPTFPEGKSDYTSQGKITLKADTFRNKITDSGNNAENKISVDESPIEKPITIKNQNKLLLKTSSNIKSLVNKKTEVSVKIKANMFKDKISAFSTDNISINTQLTKESSLDPNLVSFKNKTPLLERINNQVRETHNVMTNLYKAPVEINDNKKFTSSPSANIYALSEAFSNAQRLQLFSIKGLEKVKRIINRSIEGKILSFDELDHLKKFSDLVINNSDKLGINQDPFENLRSLTGKVQKSIEDAHLKTEGFNRNAQSIDQKLADLVNAASDPKLNLDSNFVKMLNIVSQRYKDIIFSADPDMINLFFVYIDKLIQTIQDIKLAKEKDPVIFRKLQTDYNNFSQNLFNILEQDKIYSEAGKFNLYMGELSEPFIDMLKTKFSMKSSHKEISNYNLVPTKEVMQFSSEESLIISKVSLSSVRKATSVETVINASTEINRCMKSLKIMAIDVFKAKQQLKEAISQLRKFLNFDQFKISFSELETLSEDDSLTKVLADETRAAIDRADELEAKLNLEIDNSDAPGIVDLLIKFREIITQLEMNLKQIKEQEEKSKAIDDNFLATNNDIQTRKNSLDKMMDEALKKSLKSVKEKFALSKSVVTQSKKS